jgi:hypothetical protein
LGVLYTGAEMSESWNLGERAQKNNKLSSQTVYHNQFLNKYNILPVHQPPFVLDLAPTDSVLQNEGYPKGKDTS